MLKTSATTGANSDGRGSHEIFGYLKSLGYDAADYHVFSCEPESSVYSLTDSEFDEFVLRDAAYAREIGIEIIQTHGPWPFDDRHPMQYQKKHEAMCRAIRGSAMMGAEFVVMHPVILAWQENPQHAEFVGQNVKYFKELSEYAKEYNVKIAIENMPGSFVCGGRTKELADMIDAIDSEYVMACLDTGHANYSGKRNQTRESAADAVRTLADRLACLHIHDNDALDDQHLMPYFGTVNWGDFLSALKEIRYKGSINMESRPIGAPTPLKEQSDRWLSEVARYFAQEADCG